MIASFSASHKMRDEKSGGPLSLGFKVTLVSLDRCTTNNGKLVFQPIQLVFIIRGIKNVKYMVHYIVLFSGQLKKIYKM